MGARTTPEQADAEFAAAGLIPLTPFTRVGDEREATCVVCGTWRRVKLASLRSPTSFACRWCHGWQQWGSWGEQARQRAEGWRHIRGPDYTRSVLEATGWIPLTEIGDEYTALGCMCASCGETFVTMPERFDPRKPGWYGCQRCETERNRAARGAAARVYADAGLRLLADVRGQWTAYPCECAHCGALRHVSYQDALNGTGPSCWSCTYGIMPDEPHRVYLFRFPDLGVLKVGITHNRHDHRLQEHRVRGGELVDVVVVPDRRAALAVETWVLAHRAQWRVGDVGPDEFPQGGWTEAWSDTPDSQIDLHAIAASVTGATGGTAD